MFKSPPKIVNYIVAILLVIIASITGYIFFAKPKISIAQLKTEASRVEIIPQNIGLDYSGQKIGFDNLHELSINDKKSSISKEFNLSLDDFNDGQNTIEFSGVTQYGPLTLVSQDKKKYQFNVDKTPPELSATSDISKFVLLEDVIKVKLQTEAEAKIFVNEKEVSTCGLDNLEICLDVIDGQNDFKITAKDLLGNESKPVEVKFDALQRLNWEKYQCGDVILPINLNNLQRGYIDILFYGGTFSGKVFKSPSPDQVKYLKETQEGNCKNDAKDNRNLITINPKGYKLQCFNCGGVPYPYIAFQSYLESAKINLDPQQKLTKTAEFKTKSGITGVINEYFTKGSFNPGGYGGDSSRKVFEVKQDGKIYQFISVTRTPEIGDEDPNFYKNIEKDFIDTIDYFQFAPK